MSAPAPKIQPDRPLTASEKQARYRDRYRRMQQALAVVLDAGTLREAKAAARQALAD